MANGKQPGPDRLPNEMLKALSESKEFCQIIAKLFTACIHSGMLPNDWKLSSIFLVFKTGNPADPVNYRPIALLNSTNKLFTTLINTRLSLFLESQQVFSTMQGGFRMGKTTYTKMWTLVHTIEHANSHNRALHVSYIDVKKAYDSVEHWGLQQVMEEYGFSPMFIKLINNLCINNFSQVITPHGMSNEFKVTRGVRQGCPLSPTLFILFLNPLLT